MLEIIIIAVVGTALAGLWDLKTTEVPDHLPFVMIGIGVLYWLINAATTGVYTSLIISVSVGTLLLAGGLVMYKKGQWGGADAWILAAVGYMIPVYGGALFIFPYLMNFALVAIIYTVVYALAIGVMNPHLFGLFAKSARKKAWMIITPIVALLGSVMTYAVYSSVILQPIIFLLAFASFVSVFFIYAKTVEAHYFTRKIPAGKLRKGDVLEKGNWVGLSDSEIHKLKSSKKYVTIKDGVRFVPFFAITLVLTLLYGNLFFVIF